MAFTKGRWEAFFPHDDGTEYVINPWIISGTVGATKVASGDYAATLGNSITAELVYKMPAILRPGEVHLEEINPSFGALTGPNYEQYNPPTGPPYTIPGPNAQSPIPVLKGVVLKSIDVIYAVAGATLTSATVGVFAKADSNNAAPVVTTLIAQAANGLATAVQTDRYVINVPVPSSEQNFIVTPDSVIVAELDLETASGGTADVFGVCFNFRFNYD